mgnify:CR=1 FL=1
MNNKILIIETDDVFMGQCKTHLEGLGIKVLVSGTGPEGLRMIKQEKPGAVILDITLPYLNGFHVCKLIKSDPRFKDIPVIFVSSKENSDIILQTKRVGGDLFLRKPINSDQLTEQLVQLIVRKPQVDDTAAPAVDDTAAPAVDATAAPAVDATATPAVEDTAVPAVEDTAVPAVEDTAVPAVDATATPAVDATATPAVDTN